MSTNTLLEETFVLRLGAAIFFISVIHALFVDKFIKLSFLFQKHSITNKFLHFLGEIEVVFGFWAFVFLSLIAYIYGIDDSIKLITNESFTEPVFVFVIMCISSTKPVINLAQLVILYVSKILSKILKIDKNISYFNCLFILGPLSGSILTEPVSITLTAMLAKDTFFQNRNNLSFKYSMLALLFVSVSIGGTLTHFAAPPILMIASKWGWGIKYMFLNFGISSIISIIISCLAVSFIFRKNIKESETVLSHGVIHITPTFVSFINIAFMSLVIIYHNYTAFMIALFLIFLGWFEVTKEYQKHLKIRESLLVGFFLAGLVVLGNFQGWWIKPLIGALNHYQLMLGTLGLTAIADNAAITFLASQITTLSEGQKYAIVAGAVSGGGLTIMANAPNPIGYGILRKSFGITGIKPASLFLYALPFTLISILCFIFF